MKFNKFAHHGFAVLSGKPSDQTRPLTNFFNVAHLPGNIPQKQDLLTVSALDVYHLTAWGVAGRFDQHHARRDRLIGLIVNSLVAVEDARRYVWRGFLSLPNDFLQLGNLDLRKTRLSQQILEIGLSEKPAGMIRMLMSHDNQLSRCDRGAEPRIGRVIKIICTHLLGNVSIEGRIDDDGAILIDDFIRRNRHVQLLPTPACDGEGFRHQEMSDGLHPDRYG